MILIKIWVTDHVYIDDFDYAIKTMSEIIPFKSFSNIRIQTYDNANLADNHSTDQNLIVILFFDRPETDEEYQKRLKKINKKSKKTGDP